MRNPVWPVKWDASWMVVVLVCASMGLGVRLANGQETVAVGAPVEEDMHEFMEYVFQPTYQRLKRNMAQLAGAGADWTAVKSDALILAEAANLLAGRGAGDDAGWLKHAEETRQTGATLYAAGKAKDAVQARAAYVAMLARCNACHDEFADGEHQLKP